MVRLAFPSLSMASVICVAAQIRMSASQMVAMPYSPGVTFTVTPLTLYSIGRPARLLRQAEERPLHRVPLVADRDVGIGGAEDVELDGLVAHWPSFSRSAARACSTVAPMVQFCWSAMA